MSVGLCSWSTCNASPARLGLRGLERSGQGHKVNEHYSLACHDEYPLRSPVLLLRTGRPHHRPPLHTPESPTTRGQPRTLNRRSNDESERRRGDPTSPPPPHAAKKVQRGCRRRARAEHA
eukprot:3639848-Prymnesium_polylepis.1